MAAACGIAELQLARLDTVSDGREQKCRRCHTARTLAGQEDGGVQYAKVYAGSGCLALHQVGSVAGRSLLMFLPVSAVR